MDLGLVIALTALGIGLIAVLKVPRQAFLRQPDPALETRVDALEAEVARLRQELESTQERLDFAERALSRPPESGRLPST